MDRELALVLYRALRLILDELNARRQAGQEDELAKTCRRAVAMVVAFLVRRYQFSG